MTFLKSNGINMYLVSIKTTLSLMLLGLLTLTACSSNKIRTLTIVEKAQQLIKDQVTNNFDTTKLPVKINVVMPEKAIVGKQLDIELEFSSDSALPELILAYEPSAGLVFSKKWYFFKQETVTQTFKNIKADQLYRRTISIIPEKDGVLYLNIYSIYPQGADKIAKKVTVSLSIGNSLKRLSSDQTEIVN